MEEKKDFLDQFSNMNKPESFQEEKRVPVQKKKFEPNWKLMGILSAVLTIVLAVIYFLFLAPKIVVPNFIGMPKAEVATWVRQQGIDGSGIVMKDEFSLEFPADSVISQSIEEGSKVGKNAKITFIISKGGDPDEEIPLPNINEMTREEISQWIEKNKLTKTKITAVYSSSVAEGKVISYDLKSEDGSFKRGTSLVVTISKGIEPSKKVIVADFKGKTEADVLAWAGKNKVKVKAEKEFSNTVSVGNITRTSPAKGENMETEGTLIYYVSEGKGIVVPNFVGMSKDQFENWKRMNKNVLIDDANGRYSNQKGFIVSQSPAAGSLVRAEEGISLVKNLGNKFYADKVGISLVNERYELLVDKLNELRSQGIDAYADNWTAGEEIYSQEYSRGKIISVQCTSRSTNQRYACDGALPLDVRFDVVISKGLTWTLEKPVDTVEGLIQQMNKQKEAKGASVTFLLDPSIKADDYDKQAAVYLDDQQVTQIYEDKEYVIRKVQ